MKSPNSTKKKKKNTRKMMITTLISKTLYHLDIVSFQYFCWNFWLSLISVYVTNCEFPQVGASGVRIIISRGTWFVSNWMGSLMKAKQFENSKCFSLQSEYNTVQYILVVACIGHLLDLYIARCHRKSKLPHFESESASGPILKE